MRAVGKKVAAVVVTYNRKEQLLECIGSLRRQTYTDMDILIVDNGSTDGTREAVKRYHGETDICYINTGKNMGGAGGFNFGLRIAAERGYGYAWLMDDDAVPERQALEVLAAAGEELGDFGFLSGRVVWTDGTVCMMNRQRDLRFRNIDGSPEKTVRCVTATFVSFYVPISVVREVGLPIREFFIWADDLEYSRRISRRYPCYVVPESIVVHKCKMNTGGDISVDIPERIERYGYAYRNEVYVYRREGIWGIVRLVLRTPLHIVRVLVYSPDKKMKRIKVIICSTLKGIGFRPEIEYIG